MSNEITMKYAKIGEKLKEVVILDMQNLHN